MPLIGRVCKRGIWDETIPGIKFDADGVSNYAILFDKLCEAYPRGEQGEETWRLLINKIKTKGYNKKYDCIIGVSGGTDSSYLLYLAKKYGLRPLAVNLDNGWNSDISVKNIKKMTKALNIDLETYVIDYEEIKDLMKSYIKAGLPWVDIPTDLAIKAILYKIASRERISYILRGNDFRSEGSQPNEWTYGDGRQLKFVNREFGNVNLKSFPNYTFVNLFYYGFIKSIKSVYPYYYLYYNKTTAQKFLSQNYDWEYYGGHHHENLFTKFAVAIWLFDKFGIDKRKITMSAQILSGEISREYAINEIKNTPYLIDSKNDTLIYVCKKLDMTLEEYNLFLNMENKNFSDYPSYDFLFSKFLKYSSPLLNLIFIHKPQSIFQLEMRKKD